MQEQKKMEDNVVFIGKKPIYKYTDALQKICNDGKAEMVIRARGNNISQAVDLALHKNFEKLLETKDVNIFVEEVDFRDKEGKTTEEGKKKRISCIEITLKKK